MRLLFISSLALMLAKSALADPTSLSGQVTKVRDGDTIEIIKIPVRLQGVSAPEMNEPLGPKSKAFMSDLALHKRVTCELTGSKTHDRWVGICYLDGQDIGQAVIEAGLALDCPRYSGGKYAEFEMEGVAITLPGYCR